MPFIDYYTGSWIDEETAIKQTVDCAILSIPGEWSSADASNGTQLLPHHWRGDIDNSFAETLIRNALERFRNWFVVLSVKFRIEPPLKEGDDTFFVIDVITQVVSTLVLFPITVAVNRGGGVLFTVNGNLFLVNNNRFELNA